MKTGYRIAVVVVKIWRLITIYKYISQSNNNNKIEFHSFLVYKYYEVIYLQDLKYDFAMPIFQQCRQQVGIMEE